MPEIHLDTIAFRPDKRLEAALIAMGKVCDGASTTDKVGFSRNDPAYFAPHLATAQAGGAIAPSIRPKVVKRLEKYSGQLFKAGINFNDILVEEAELAAVAASSTDDEKPPALGEQLLELAASWELTAWESYAYATAQVKLEDGTCRKETRRFPGPVRQMLVQEYYAVTKRAPSSEALKQTIETLEAKANFEAKEERVYLRAAAHGDRIYYDLANPRGEVVEISADGWNITQDPPVKFLRVKAARAQVTPMNGGSIELLKPFVNLAGMAVELAVSSWILLVAFLYFSFFPDYPHPILQLNGQQGSGKSVLCRLLRRLLDPHPLEIRAVPKDSESLAVAAKNSWVVCLDNMVEIKDWLSDMLCQVSTGGGSATRQLYTNDEESVVTFLRPIILNGIAGEHGREDLGDRILKIDLGSAVADADRLTDEDIYERFEEVRPLILGAFFDAIAVGLRNKGKVKAENLPRMASFAQAVLEAEEHLPWEPGEFLPAFDNHRQAQIESQLEGDPFAAAIQSLVKAAGIFEGTATDLLERLKGETKGGAACSKCGGSGYIEEYSSIEGGVCFACDGDGIRRSKPAAKMGKGWPTVHDIQKRLTYMGPFLRKVGIEVTSRRTKAARLICLARIESKGVEPADDSGEPMGL